MENLKNNLKILLSDSFDKELVDYAFRNLEDKTRPIAHFAGWNPP